MSQRVDERTPTKIEFAVYNAYLKLSDFTTSVCRHKDKNVNNKHVAKRDQYVANKIDSEMDDIGSNILEANSIYVGSSLKNLEMLKQNYFDRIKLEEEARRLTYRIENKIRRLHSRRPFANSTITYWMKLLIEERKLIIAWKEHDYEQYKKIN